MNKKAFLLRYVQLILKQEHLKLEGKALSDEEISEIESMKIEIGLSHEEIYDEAIKVLVDEMKNASTGDASRN